LCYGGAEVPGDRTEPYDRLPSPDQQKRMSRGKLKAERSMCAFINS
jgi:hypothetical protein